MYVSRKGLRPPDSKSCTRNDASTWQLTRKLMSNSRLVDMGVHARISSAERHPYQSDCNNERQAQRLLPAL